MKLLKEGIHPINFWTSWRPLSGFILVIVNTFSGLGSIPCRETIYLSSFPQGTSNVHFLEFSFILNFLRLSKVCQVKDESLIYLSLDDHVINVCFSVAPELSV
jgi:hypothetical protein